MWASLKAKVKAVLVSALTSKTATLGGGGTAIATWLCQAAGLSAEQTALVLTGWAALCTLVGTAVKLWETRQVAPATPQEING
jgi:uncharacterized membrane protein YebE (DUF533 family)